MGSSENDYWWREARSGSSFIDYRLMKGNSERAVLLKWNDTGYVWADRGLSKQTYERIHGAETLEEAKAYVLACVKLE